MMRILKFILPLLLLLCFARLQAQEVWQVDARATITTQQRGIYTILTIKVKVDNDDTARSPRLTVSLPRNSKVEEVKIKPNVLASPYKIRGNVELHLPHNPLRVDSAVEFDLRNLNKEEFTVRIRLTSVNDGFRPNAVASAFIHTITPELNKRNNYDDCKIR